jgi:hypothetical protein
MMVRFTFEGVKNQAEDKGLILEKSGKVYLLWHPKCNRFGESECQNLHECMSEILSFDIKHYQDGDKGRDSSEISCLT